MALEDPLEPLLSSLRAVLARGPSLRLAALFGSVATGKSHPSSDLDIAILLCDPALALGAELTLQAELARSTGRSVDLIRLDEASTLLRWQVARDGLLLLSDPPHEWPRFRAAAASDYCDFAPALKEASRLFHRRLTQPGRLASATPTDPGHRR